MSLGISAIKMKRLVEILYIVAENSSCCMLKVSAIVVDSNLSIISTGYNGTPAGSPNCDTYKTKEDHYSWDEIHAEINALALATPASIVSNNRFILVKNLPCQSCTQAIVANMRNLDLKAIYYLEDYKDDKFGDHQMELCEKAGIDLVKLTL